VGNLQYFSIFVVFKLGRDETRPLRVKTCFRDTLFSPKFADNWKKWPIFKSIFPLLCNFQNIGEMQSNYWGGNNSRKNIEPSERRLQEISIAKNWPCAGLIFLILHLKD